MKKFSDRLKELRGTRSQSEVADLLGIKQNAWSRYELGAATPGADMLIQICTTFGVSADWLLGLSDDRGGVSPSEASELVTQIKSLESRVRSLESSTSFGRCG